MLLDFEERYHFIYSYNVHSNTSAVSNDVTIVYVVFDLITYFSMKSVRLAKTNFLYCQTQRYVFDVETPKSIFLTVHYPIEVKCKA